MPLFQGFRPVAGTICPSRAAAVVGPSRAPQGMKKGRRPRRRPRLKLSDKAGPDQCPVPGENALFPAQIAGFLAVSRPVPVYPVFLNYVVPVQESKRDSPKTVSSLCWRYLFSRFVSKQVSSAQVSLTSVFGMGTGGPSLQSTPTAAFRQAIQFCLAPARLGDPYGNRTHVCGVRGRRLNRLTNGPLVHLQGLEPWTP